MTKTLDKAERKQRFVVPSVTLHRRFSSDGKATPPPPDRVKTTLWMVFVPTDVSTCGAFAAYGAKPWWEAAGASVVQPVIQVNINPALEAFWTRWGETCTAKKPSRVVVREGSIENFLEEVYRLGKLNDLQAATDRVFRYIDDLLLVGAYPTCDEILKRADIKRLPTALMRSFLTITAVAKGKLLYRKPFYRDAFAEMVRLKGDEKAQRLLGRLA